MGPFPITFGRHFFGRVVLLDLLSACNLGGCGRRGRGRSEKGKGGARRRDHPGAISAAIREEFGTKTEVSHDGGFISALHRGLLFGRGKNSQVSASPNSRATHDSWLPRGIPRFSCQDLPWGLYYFRLARHSDSEEQLALPSVRFSCLLLEATPYGYRAAILRMPCNLDASSSIPISSSAW